MTGTFDDWKKSVKLEHDGTTWQKTVSLPASTDKVYYKVRCIGARMEYEAPLTAPVQYVVDGEWTTSDAKSETDSSGNVNNYLTADDLAPPTNSQANPIISSVAPSSS